MENLCDAGKKRVDRVQAVIESELVYPCLRGRDVRRWYGVPRGFVLAPQDVERQREGIAETEMRRRYPLTYAYLKRFERELADRPDRKYYPEGAPFYTMRNVASYTRSSWKVVFKDLSEVLECLVVGPQSLGEDVKPVFPDLTLRLIPVASEAEAHFVAGLLNSSPSILLLHASSVGVQTQRYHPGDIGKIQIPRFNEREPTHQELGRLSVECHEAAAKGQDARLEKTEELVDRAAGSLWSLTKYEIVAVQEAVRQIKRTRGYRRVPLPVR